MNSSLAPVHRLVGGVLISMVLAFVLWASFGRLDIVVQAQGKVIPAGAVKVMQPVEAGPVAELFVQDGQSVKAGDLLARMDSTQPREDVQALTADRDLNRARITAATSALQGHLVATGQALVDTEFRLRAVAYEDAKRGAQSALDKAQQELAATEQTLTKQRKTFEIAQQAETTQGDLKAQGLVTGSSFDDKQKDRIEREQDAKSLEATALANTAAIAQAQAALSQVTSDFNKQLAQDQTQALAALQKTLGELAKAEHRAVLDEVRAPVAGVVTGLTVHAVGQVVAAGTPLLTLVPTGETLMVEGWVRNEDAGFVAPGLPAKVKLATFPFQKYGWLTGEVTWVGADSEVPESMRNAQGDPLFYKARIALHTTTLKRDGKSFEAKPGMQAVVDVQLGERSLLEYLTSPLKKAVLEAARER